MPRINSPAPERCGSNFNSVISEHMLQIVQAYPLTTLQLISYSEFPYIKCTCLDMAYLATASGCVMSKLLASWLKHELWWQDQKQEKLICWNRASGYLLHRSYMCAMGYYETIASYDNSAQLMLHTACQRWRPYIVHSWLFVGVWTITWVVSI